MILITFFPLNYVIISNRFVLKKLIYFDVHNEIRSMFSTRAHCCIIVNNLDRKTQRRRSTMSLSASVFISTCARQRGNVCLLLNFDFDLDIPYRWIWLFHRFLLFLFFFIILMHRGKTSVPYFRSFSSIFFRYLKVVLAPCHHHFLSHFIRSFFLSFHWRRRER